MKGKKPTVRQAKTYIKSMPSGKSKPLLFETTDGILWVVKYKNNPQGLKTLVNEWVASNLAQLLELPVPECSIIMLNKQLLEIDNISIPGTQTAVQPGLSFGSRYVDRANNNPTHYQMDRLDNLDIIPGIVVMDTWIDNPDRNDRDKNFSNILVSPSSVRSKYTLHLIDNGKIVSSNWDVRKLLENINSLKIRGYNRLFSPLILGKPAFQLFLEKVESVSKIDIEEVVEDVPEKWNMTQEEKAALMEFISKRKYLVRKIIEAKFH